MQLGYRRAVLLQLNKVLTRLLLHQGLVQVVHVRVFPLFGEGGVHRVQVTALVLRTYRQSTRFFQLID